MTDLNPLAAEMGRRLLERRNVKAIQNANGSWRPVRDKDGVAEPWTMADLRSHLAGEKTYGHYLVSPEGNCRVFAFDIDLVKPNLLSDPPFQPHYTDELGIQHNYNPREYWLAVDPRTESDDTTLNYLRVGLAHMADGLAHMAHDLLEIPVGVAYSGGKGVHVYGFLEPMPAAQARDAALTVLEAFGSTFGEKVDHAHGKSRFEPARGNNFFRHSMVDGPYRDLEIEVFPKQDEVTDLGNLMRLPLGINRKTGQPGYFLNFDDGWSTFVEDDPLLALTEGSIR